MLFFVGLRRKNKFFHLTRAGKDVIISLEYFKCADRKQSRSGVFREPLVGEKR